MTSKGVKLTNDKSKFAAPPRPVSPEQFQQQAVEEHEKRAARNKLVLETGQQLVKILEDKILPENRTAASISVENEIIAKMVNLAVEINDDEKEHEGIGWMGLILLLISQCQKSRDRFNLAEFKVKTLESQVANLEKQLNSLEAKIQPK
jgi:hypothetical protein